MIDAVIISHNHYDHLSYPGVMEISKRHPNCHFFVPLGNKSWFNGCGIKNVTELDWWDERDITMSPSVEKVTHVEAAGEAASLRAEIKARISCLPCQHVSVRTPFDRYQTLWCSWAVESGGSKVYFTGYVNDSDMKSDHIQLIHPPEILDIERFLSYPMEKMTTIQSMNFPFARLSSRLANFGDPSILASSRLAHTPPVMYGMPRTSILMMRCISSRRPDARKLWACTGGLGSSRRRTSSSLQRSSRLR